MTRPYLIRQQQLVGDRSQQVITLPDSQAQPAPNPLLRRIYALLDGQRVGVLVNVDWLADQLAVNRKTLYRYVLHLTRLSPADLIRQYYLHKAASLLREGYTAAEVAYSVGFTTPSHFAAVFKQHYGHTPSQYGSATQQQPQMPPI